MELNITGDLWGMPLNLIGQVTQESSIEITDLLPLAGVIVGAVITYYTTRSGERSKRQYELKSENYLKITEILADMFINQVFNYVASIHGDEELKKEKKDEFLRAP